MTPRARIFTHALNRVAAEFNIEPEALIGRDRTPFLASMRGMAALVIRHSTPATLLQIGTVLGGRDHSTINNMIAGARKSAKASEWFRQRCEKMILDIIEELHGEPPELFEISGLPCLTSWRFGSHTMRRWPLAQNNNEAQKNEAPGVEAPDASH